MTITNKVLDVNHGGTGINGADPNAVANITVLNANIANTANYAERLIDTMIGGDLDPVYIDDTGTPAVAYNAGNIIKSVATKYVTSISELINTLTTESDTVSVIIGQSIEADTPQSIQVSSTVKSISGGSRATSVLTSISLDFSHAPNCTVSNLSLLNGNISDANNLTRCTITDGSFINCNKLYSCKVITTSADPSQFNRCSNLFGCDGDRVNCTNIDTDLIPKIIDGQIIVTNASYASKIGVNGNVSQPIGDANSPVYVSSDGTVTQTTYNLANITSDINDLSTSKFDTVTNVSDGDLVTNIVNNGTTIEFDKVNSNILNVNSAIHANIIVDEDGDPVTVGNWGTPVYLSKGIFEKATDLTNQVNTIAYDVSGIISGSVLVGKSSVLAANQSGTLVNLNVGTANDPVYFSNGVPVAITSINTRLNNLESTRVNAISNGTSFDIVTGLQIIDGTTINVTGTNFSEVTVNAAKQLVDSSNDPINVGSNLEFVYFNNGVPIASGITVGTNEHDVPQLGPNGRLPASMLPETALEYQDTLDATTIKPSATVGQVPEANTYIDQRLPNPIKGDFFIAGTSTNSSDANLATFTYNGTPFYDGDWILYNGTTWKKNANNTRVSSVQGQVGAVQLELNNNGSNGDRIGLTGGSSVITINNVSYANTSGIANKINSNGTNVTVNIEASKTIAAADYIAIVNGSNIINKANSASVRSYLNISNVNDTADGNKDVNSANYANYAGKITSATTNIGNSNTPVYVLNGVITNLPYTIKSNVPASAVIANKTPSIGINGSNIGLNWNGAISSEITVPYATNAGTVKVATYTGSNFSLLAGNTLSGNAVVYANANLKFNAASKTLITDNIKCTNSLTVNGWTFSISNIS